MWCSWFAQKWQLMSARCCSKKAFCKYLQRFQFKLPEIQCNKTLLLRLNIHILTENRPSGNWECSYISEFTAIVSIRKVHHLQGCSIFGQYLFFNGSFSVRPLDILYETNRVGHKLSLKTVHLRFSLTNFTSYGCKNYENEKN